MMPLSSLDAVARSGCSRLDDFDFRKRKNHLAARGEILALAVDDSLLEVPGKDEEIVGMHCPRLDLRNDRNVCPGRIRTKLVAIHFRNRLDRIRAEPAKLEN